MNIAKCCILKSIDHPGKSILLPNKVNTILGRNKLTEIEDLYISRNQLAVTADYCKYEVKASVKGSNYCGCNGYALEKNQIYVLKHGDILSLKLTEHQFQISFEPAPKTKDVQENLLNEPENKKAKLFPLFNTSQNLIQTSDNIFGKWQLIDNKCLIFSPENVIFQNKVAAFDLDGTLIRVKSGAQFPKNKNDWDIWNAAVPKKLKQLTDNEFQIIIFTNQAGIKQDQLKIKEFKEKIGNILKVLSFPAMVFASTDKSIYRKPAPGMWNLYIQIRNSEANIDYLNSFYVGDAAGRPSNSTQNKKQDFSLSDRLFAKNIGLKFFTPEEFFLEMKAADYTQPIFNPYSVFSTLKKHNNYISSSCELVVMVGFPGSGKSHFCKENFIKYGYEYANRDSLGTWQKCVKVVEEALQNNKSVVVDNTNPDIESRKRYINIAKKYHVPCRCFIMTPDINHARHNVKFRELYENYTQKVTDSVLYTYKKNFIEPSIEEGFSEIIRCEFVPKFDDTEKEKLYKMFLLEK